MYLSTCGASGALLLPSETFSSPAAPSPPPANTRGIRAAQQSMLPLCRLLAIMLSSGLTKYWWYSASWTMFWMVSGFRLSSSVQISKTSRTMPLPLVVTAAVRISTGSSLRALMISDSRPRLSRHLTCTKMQSLPFSTVTPAFWVCCIGIWGIMGATAPSSFISTSSRLETEPLLPEAVGSSLTRGPTCCCCWHMISCLSRSHDPW
mmetsp:Transcript_15304/g.33132  ORF Transcript_15304/g.33132 Transcript_15304/m.33132 type:complete len:206 (+) Transcript_15304:2399-3016(+)